MGESVSHTLRSPVSREERCAARPLPRIRWPVAPQLRACDALAYGSPYDSTSGRSSMARLSRFSASNPAVAYHGDASFPDDATMWPSAADGSTNLAPNVGVLV
ncbi:hypothetical protein T01_13397 [Trichinella spiralis]|uniref:Uncharacterized protein n=1 Tax=Trichinella spiralis TaxID=6334 RepID=A0A0V1C0G9_TRISP|nr:hypothetical protein T01_13397 [Trichinella spiralis]